MDSAIYFQMGATSFGKLVKFFVGDINLPAFINNLVSIKSLIINYNPSQSSINATTDSDIPPTSNIVARDAAQCGSPRDLLSFNAPLPGVSNSFIVLLIDLFDQLVDHCRHS